MTERNSTVSPRLHGRLAGLTYLIIIFVGGAGYFASSALIARGDAAATATNILASEHIWRLGLSAMLVMLICDVILASIFYVLFKPVNRTLSLIGMALRLVMTAIQAVALLALLAAPILLRDERAGAAFDADQVQAAAYFSLRLFNQGFEVGLVFFGVDCLVIGWLIFRSTFLPRVLGVLLALAGLSYLINSFSDFIFPAFAFPFDILMPAYVAELALALWLVVMSVNAEKWKASDMPADAQRVMRTIPVGGRNDGPPY
jgi:hypothetical protein